MEQRLIDANDINVEDTIGGRNEFADCIRDSVECVLNNAPTVFTIPENPTNGDMIKAMFPYIEIKDNCDMYYSVNIENLSTDKGLNTIGFRKDWWNAPYKKGDASE